MHNWNNLKVERIRFNDREETLRSSENSADNRISRILESVAEDSKTSTRKLKSKVYTDKPNTLLEL